MSLPNGFSNPEQYFEECMKFLEEYQYLYHVSNIHVLNFDVLDHINTNFEVIDEEIQLNTVNDEYLSNFFAKLKRFQVVHGEFRPKDVEDDINVPASCKKKHEIRYLAKEIKNVCEDVGCQMVVDFGAGLGYLDQLIFETTSYKVLGIECNESYHDCAKKRQRKYYKDSIEHVKYVKHTIQEDSHEYIKAVLEQKFENHQTFCIAGLHACADLSIDAINIFLKMAQATAIVIMSCCYHQMFEERGKFKNFPLSMCLKEIFQRHKGEYYLIVPFLRLATQPPHMDAKLDDSVFNLLARAVLQVYADKHNYRLSRKKRKAVNTKTMDNNFDAYIQDATTNGFMLLNNESYLENNSVETPTFDVEELKLIWNEVIQTKLKKAKLYILLQNNLQPVLENFVLYDRLLYLKENGIKHCTVKKIFNEWISPRCLALIAYKDV